MLWPRCSLAPSKSTDCFIFLKRQIAIYFTIPLMWNCLIIEDDLINARFIADGFINLSHRAQVCADGDQGLKLALEHDWDLIVLDRMLPKGVDGLSILKALRDAGKSTPVLVLSALSGLDDKVRGLKAGGDDYLSKPFELAELLARAEALVRRSRGMSSDEVNELQAGDLRVDLLNHRVTRADELITLQPRELRLLVYLLHNQDQVVTRSMLLESVWDYCFDPQTNVIDVQISRLRNKIDRHFSYPLIHTIRGVGYMLSVEGPKS